MAAEASSQTAEAMSVPNLKSQSSNLVLRNDLSLYPKPIDALVECMKRSVLGYALTCTPSVPATLVHRAHYTSNALFDSNNQVKSIFYEAVDAKGKTKKEMVVPSADQLVSTFNEIGYEPPLERISTFKKNQLPDLWRYFFSIFLRCLSGRTSGLDSASVTFQGLLYGIYYDVKVDFATILWTYFCSHINHSMKGTEIENARFWAIVVHAHYQQIGYVPDPSLGEMKFTPIAIPILDDKPADFCAQIPNVMLSKVPLECNEVNSYRNTLIIPYPTRDMSQVAPVRELPKGKEKRKMAGGPSGPKKEEKKRKTSVKTTPKRKQPKRQKKIMVVDESSDSERTPSTVHEEEQEEELFADQPPSPTSTTRPTSPLQTTIPPSPPKTTRPPTPTQTIHPPPPPPTTAQKIPPFTLLHRKYHHHHQQQQLLLQPQKYLSLLMDEQNKIQSSFEKKLESAVTSINKKVDALAEKTDKTNSEVMKALQGLRSESQQSIKLEKQLDEARAKIEELTAAQTTSDITKFTEELQRTNAALTQDLIAKLRVALEPLINFSDRLSRPQGRPRQIPAATAGSSTSTITTTTMGASGSAGAGSSTDRSLENIIAPHMDEIYKARQADYNLMIKINEFARDNGEWTVEAIKQFGFQNPNLLNRLPLRSFATVDSEDTQLDIPFNSKTFAFLQFVSSVPEDQKANEVESRFSIADFPIMNPMDFIQILDLLRSGKAAYAAMSALAIKNHILGFLNNYLLQFAKQDLELCSYYR
ncbi:hypothetical protein L2E82_25345 [Cichorium intybus]|uniref:Uncharacterized protein n=1 Tax=Cichorium intybus TaxID=13427 RepID=A0ACB9E3N4_CICIN|nr:hypothetical protein L2E82_25345 [Cichorium intybus]